MGDAARVATAVDTAAVDSDAISGRAWRTLALVSAAMFVIIVDTTVVNVAFPFIERSFPDTPRATLAWVSTGNSIATGALLLLAGRLADRYGRRRLFLLGMAVFTVGSLGSAAAPHWALLIASRVVQGVGGALLTATAVALLLPQFPPRKRGLALGIWGTIGSAGAATGPTLGALAIEASSWRLAFLVNVPIAAVALLAGPRVLTEDRPGPGADAPRIDLAGAAVGTTGTALAILGLLQGPRWGWTSGSVVGCGVAAAVLLAGFLWRCTRIDHPLVDLGVLSRRTFVAANLSQAGTQMAIFVWFFTTPLFLINVWRYSALAGGSAVAVGMGVSFVSIPVGHWSDRHGYKQVLIVGGLVAVAGMAWWVTTVEAEPNYWTGYFPGLVIFGVGAGMVGIVVTNAALAGIPEADLGMANAAFQTTRRLMGAVGIAIAVAILGDRSTDSLAAFRGTWLLIGGGYLFSVLAIAAYPSRRPAATSE